jgi:hypothetical protein
METFYIVIVVFLLGLAIFDLYTGVSSAVVAFLPPAIGAKAAKLKTLLLIAGIGIIVGTATSSGMMDIARHGVLQPIHYSYYEVMCVFLSVVCCDVMIIDIFNTLGMPTSTTVSMMFELFGGTTALAVYKILKDTTGTLTYGTLVNTDKVLSVIMAIFLSVAIAFVIGMVVMWITRVVFTFHYERHMKWAIGLFGGFSIASILDFILTKGLGQASFMTPDIKAWLTGNSTAILLGCFIGFTVITQVLYWLKVNVFKVIVIFGTFALAMAFAGNDLVNFIGVALAGLDSTRDFLANGNGNPSTFMMGSLQQSAKTPLYILIISGGIMATALFISRKARKVINTTLNLSRQDSGDEIFSSSRIARRLVRATLNTTQHVLYFVPRGVRNWVNSRFEKPKEEELENNGNAAAFDLVRASVNLVFSGLLIVIGTSMQLPLSTTYVAFMVSMGSSLADRAWGRDSAVYRITGVISVIGGWFITAGAAFMLCFIITSAMYFGGPIAIGIIVLIVIAILVHNNINFKEKPDDEGRDVIYHKMIASKDKAETFELLKEHITLTHSQALTFAKDCFYQITDGLITENVHLLRKTDNALTAGKDQWKKQRQKEIVGMRLIDYYTAVQKNTWFHLSSNSITEILYCLKRMNDPCLEHVDNNFNPLPKAFVDEFVPIRDEVVEMMDKAVEILNDDEYNQIEPLLAEGNALKSKLSHIRHAEQINSSKESANIRLDLLYLNTLQETQELVSDLRHLLRGIKKFKE